MAEEKSLALPPPPQTTTIEQRPEAQAGKLTRVAAFTPTNLTEAIALSKLIAGSELAPKDYRGKPANVLIAMQMGAEVGLAPMQALQNIAVINGRPSLWGDAALGIVQVHPMYEWHKEWMDGTGDNRTAFCQVKRKGQEAYQTSFSVAQARRAGLWDKKPSPWQSYPERMLQMRARGFALRDKFSDALRGLILAEEAVDIALDTSDAKKQRDSASLDFTTTFAPSTESNRGHEDTGFQKQEPKAEVPQEKPKKNDDVMCNECRTVNGHADGCSHKLKAEQDAKTSRPTTRSLLMVNSVSKKAKDGKDYLILDAVDDEGGKSTLYVWKTDLHEYFLAAAPTKDAPAIMTCEVSERTGKNGNIYKSLEHISELNGVMFVDNRPVDASGEVTE